MCKQIGPLKRNPKCSIIRAYCLNLVKKNVQEFVAFTLGRTSKGRQGDDFLNSQLFVGTGECTKGVRTDDIVLLLYGRHCGYFWGMGSTADSQHMSASAPPGHPG
jgi:hypothetical protein